MNLDIEAPVEDHLNLVGREFDLAGEGAFGGSFNCQVVERRAADTAVERLMQAGDGRGALEAGEGAGDGQRFVVEGSRGDAFACYETAIDLIDRHHREAGDEGFLGVGRGGQSGAECQSNR